MIKRKSAKHSCCFAGGKEQVMIKAIIFDLDGVICSTDHYHFQAWKELADSLKIPFTEDDNHRLRGVSRMDSLEIILEKSPVSYSEEEKLEFAEWKYNRYRELLSTMTEQDLSAEVMETLEELRHRGFNLAIGSSSKNAKFILERLGLADFFDAISDGTNITRSKPDPEVFLKAAEMLEEQPEDCLVIEDALAGIEAAITGKFHAAGINEAAQYTDKCVPLKNFRNILDIL